MARSGLTDHAPEPEPPPRARLALRCALACTPSLARARPYLPPTCLLLIWQCAMENKILGVEEPEVCKYAMRLETPAACTEEHVAEAKRDAEALAAPPAHDEL